MPACKARQGSSTQVFFQNTVVQCKLINNVHCKDWGEMFIIFKLHIGATNRSLIFRDQKVKSSQMENLNISVFFTFQSQKIGQV